MSLNKVTLHPDWEFLQYLTTEEFNAILYGMFNQFMITMHAQIYLLLSKIMQMTLITQTQQVH